MWNEAKLTRLFSGLAKHFTDSPSLKEGIDRSVNNDIHVFCCIIQNDRHLTTSKAP